MKLLISAHNFPPQRGGIQRFSDALARHVAPGATTVLAAPHPAAESHDAHAPYEIRRERLVGRYPPRWVATSLALRRALRATNPDAVLCAEWWPHARALNFTPRREELRAVLVHGTEIARSLSSPRARRALEAALGGCDVVIANSRFTASLLIPLGVTPSVIHPGVEFPAPEPASEIVPRLGLEGKRIVLTVARLVPRKGQLRFLHAWAEVVRTISDAVWVIVGDGPDREPIEKAALSMPSVFVAGELSDADIQALYAAASIHLLPGAEVEGDIEGFGMAAVEAGVHGTPTIATDTGGTKEAVGLGGIIVQPGDDRSLAAEICDLLRDDQRHAELSAHALANARDLSWPRVAERVRNALGR